MLSDEGILVGDKDAMAFVASYRSSEQDRATHATIPQYRAHLEGVLQEQPFHFDCSELAAKLARARPQLQRMLELVQLIEQHMVDAQCPRVGNSAGGGKDVALRSLLEAAERANSRPAGRWTPATVAALFCVVGIWGVHEYERRRDNVVKKAWQRLRRERGHQV
jgi:hypothetical protein